MVMGLENLEEIFFSTFHHPCFHFSLFHVIAITITAANGIFLEKDMTFSNLGIQSWFRIGYWLLDATASTA